MIWYYKRINQENTKMSTILCNTWMFYARSMVLMIGVVACFLNQVVLAGICLSILVVLLFKFIVKEEDIIKEIKAQTGNKADLISYSGSKYSFNNPLIITIKK